MPNPSVIGLAQEYSEAQVEIFDTFWARSTALCIEFVVRNEKLSPADISFIRGNLIGFLKEARKKSKKLIATTGSEMADTVIEDASVIPESDKVDLAPVDTAKTTIGEGLFTSINGLLTKQFQDIERYMAQYALQTVTVGVTQELKKTAAKDLTAIFSVTPDKIGRHYSTEIMIKTIFFTAAMKMYNIGMAYFLSETNTKAVLFHPNKSEVNGMTFDMEKFAEIQNKIFHPNSLAVIGPELK